MSFEHFGKQRAVWDDPLYVPCNLILAHTESRLVATKIGLAAPIARVVVISNLCLSEKLFLVAFAALSIHSAGRPGVEETTGTI